MGATKGPDSRTRSDDVAREHELTDAAAALDLHPIRCPSCSGAGAGCGNCDGKGRLWHSASGVTLSDEGLRRLIQSH